jgi:hypothetical protein
MLPDGYKTPDPQVPMTYLRVLSAFDGPAGMRHLPGMIAPKTPAIAQQLIAEGLTEEVDERLIGLPPEVAHAKLLEMGENPDDFDLDRGTRR